MTNSRLDELAQRLLAALVAAPSPEGVAAVAAAAVAELAPARRVQLWRPGPPEWRVEASHPAPPPRGAEPPDAVVEALDRDRPTAFGGWSACVAAAPGAEQPLVLALEGSIAERSLIEAAAMVGATHGFARGVDGRRRRVERLDELLRIALAWSQSSDTEALLHQVAEAATRLFACDRATVFLWDRPAQRLVGRPALGMPDGTLVVPDNAGVVGRVVQTGEAVRAAPRGQRVDPVDRSTDRKTGYRTDTLLCVPLDDPEGQRMGAFELINKTGSAAGERPEFDDRDAEGLAELARLAAAAIGGRRRLDELVERRDSLVDEAAAGATMLGECPAIVALRKTVARVADSDLAVLVLGENGTGKEVVARSLHFGGRRRAEPLLAVNCAAIAETLLESELFGHEAGAFTDARESRAGKFELAHGGTLLLDEIGDMSLAGQAKLLRVLEEKQVVRVGGSSARAVDVRVVAATNRNLAQRVREGKFREDLYYRLCVVTLELPPLRDRGDDILLLAEHFLRQFCQKRGRKTPRVSAEARKRLFAHTWPGNIRELRNLMERVAYLTEGPSIDAASLELAPSGRSDAGDGEPDGGLGLADQTRRFQRRLIQRAVERARGNVAAAAASLGLHRSNLYRKMTQLGMDTAGVEDAAEERG